MSKKRNSFPKRLERVYEAFDPAALKRICEQPEAAFSDYATKVELPDSQGWRSQWMENYYFHKDNGSQILFVAHLDNVQDDRTTNITWTADGPLVTSGALDDRLGAYVGLEMLPKLGITCDWLLTTNEEMGNSSAQWFETSKHYNWMIEFDRGGTDVVMYQFETAKYRQLIRNCGAHVGMGSYSDIADLDDLGCAGFNWGVGYEDYHSKRSHAWLDDTFRMVARFLKFYATNATTHLEHVPLSRHYSGDLKPMVLADDCPLCPGFLDDDGCCWGCGYGIKEVYGEALSGDLERVDAEVEEIRAHYGITVEPPKEETG